MQTHVSEDAQSTLNAVMVFNVPARALLSRNAALDLTLEYRWFVLSCGKMKL